MGGKMKVQDAVELLKDAMKHMSPDVKGAYECLVAFVLAGVEKDRSNDKAGQAEIARLETANAVLQQANVELFAQVTDLQGTLSKVRVLVTPMGDEVPTGTSTPTESNGDASAPPAPPAAAPIVPPMSSAAPSSPAVKHAVAKSRRLKRPLPSTLVPRKVMDEAALKLLRAVRIGSEELRQEIQRQGRVFCPYLEGNESDAFILARALVANGCARKLPNFLARYMYDREPPMFDSERLALEIESAETLGVSPAALREMIERSSEYRRIVVPPSVTTKSAAQTDAESTSDPFRKLTKTMRNAYRLDVLAIDLVRAERTRDAATYERVRDIALTQIEGGDTQDRLKIARLNQRFGTGLKVFVARIFLRPDWTQDQKAEALELVAWRTQKKVSKLEEMARGTRQWNEIARVIAPRRLVDKSTRDRQKASSAQKTPAPQSAQLN